MNNDKLNNLISGFAALDPEQQSTLIRCLGLTWIAHTNGVPPLQLLEETETQALAAAQRD